MRSPALEEALFKNRQRPAVDKLQSKLPWLTDAVFADYATSRSLDKLVRSKLEQHRPSRNGELLVTQDLVAFERALSEFFEARPEKAFYLFMFHWPEAGAMRLASAQLADHGGELLLFDGDAVYGCDEEQNEIVSLDRTVESASCTILEFFRLTTSPDRSP